ncbi:ELWxxDGT repeat protein [Aquicoccus sp.]|uniref:ELWxxDGT repeat protein n=1 Tax=Aquicoccus sp. TaxID=2055851 RepID=UPI003563813C
MSKLIFFSANDGVHGDELWATDGTPEGTRMVQDILPPENTPWPDNPDFISSNPRYLATLPDGRVVFQASDELFRRDELWVSDGTEEGTGVLRDIGGDRDSSTPRYMTPLGDGRIVFSAEAGQDMPYSDSGRELWITDGTSAGTTLLKDINPGIDEWESPLRSNPESFIALRNGKVVFTADDGEHGRELWVTDGTEAGTVMLRDFQPGPGSSSIWSLNIMELDDGRLKFEVGLPPIVEGGSWTYEEWVTDGTPEGTVPHEPDTFVAPDQPELFERGPGEAAYPTNQPFDPIGLSETRTLFGALGARQFDHDDLVGHELIPKVFFDESGVGFQVRGESGAGVVAAFTGTDGTAFAGTSIGSGGSGSLGVYSDRLAELGPGPITISAVSPPVFVTNDENVTIKITYQGGEGSVTQNYFAYSPGERWFAPSLETMEALGEGPISVVSVIGETREFFGGPIISFDLPYRVGDITGVISTGRELWRTDGTEDGTQLLADINPGLFDSSPSDFGTFSDGRILFTAIDGSSADLSEASRGLWITDGTETGTRKLADDVGGVRHVAVVNERHIVKSDEDNAVWVTDGTAAGTARIVESNSNHFQSRDLPDGRLLLEVETAPDTYHIWVSDGTQDGTRFVTDAARLSGFWGEETYFDAETLIFTYNDPDLGLELFKLDLEAGGLTLLGDINPDGSSRPTNLTLGIPEALRAPVSTLFETRVTLLDEDADTVRLDDYFTDPQGGALDFAVEGLPDGVALDPRTKAITAAPDAEPGRHEVTVIAETTLGGRTTDSFEWDLVDTGNLLIEAEGDWGRVDRDSPITLDPGKTLTIGLKGGAANLLRIEGAEATIEDGKLSVLGKVFSGQFATDRPFMEGGFTIDMTTLSVSDFEDRGIEESHRLVGDLIEMSFSDIALRSDGIVLRTDLEFGDAFSAFSTEGGLLALNVGDEGPSFGLSELGTGRWFTDEALALPLPEGAPFSVEFSNLGMSYDMLTDSIYLMGKAELSWGETVAREYSFLADSTTSKLTLDLAREDEDEDLFAKGDKFLRIGTDAEGWNWDVVGEIIYEGQEGSKPAPGRPLVEEMRFALDTVEKEVEAGFKGTLPFLFKGLTLEAEIGATWDPLAIDSFGFGIDGLNKPLGTTGLFVQGGKLAAENLSTQDPEEWPEVSAQIDMTVGPNTDLFVSPVRGNVGGKIAGAEATLGFEAESKVEYLLPGEIERIAAPMTRWLGVDEGDVLAFELMKLAGDISVNFARPTFSAGLAASFLGEMITGEARFTSETLDDVTNLGASVSAIATFPEAIPLIGGLSRSGSGLAEFSSDGDNANDFAAAWTSFSVPLYGTTSAGLRFWLDGSYEVMGRKAIEEIGSWELGPEQDLVILSAQWQNDSDTARLELIAPDGTVLTEADFGTDTGFAGAIALVDDLTGPLGRHVALQNPVAGIWDVRLVDEAGLGDVRYEASDMLTGPQASITGIVTPPGTRAGVVEIDLAPGDADEIALTLFVSETPDALSGFTVIEAVVPANEAGALSFDWDFAALASGSWWLHARAEGDGLVPAVDMFATPIEVSGNADLEVLLEQQPAAGGATVLSVTVTNAGDIASGAGWLELSAPDAALDGPGLPDTQPLTQTLSEIVLPDLAPGASTRLDFALPSGLEVMAQPVIAEVSTAVYDADLDNNSDVLFLAALSVERDGAITTRGGTGLEGAEVTASLDDGSSVSALTGPDGGFTLEGIPAGAVGTVDASHAFNPAETGITPNDALEILRIAVGLQPGFGPAGPLDHIAADIDQSGEVTPGDALEVLRTAVNLPSEHAPQWIFVDATADLSGITRDSVHYDPGIDLGAHPVDMPLDMTAVLLGNLSDAA